VSTIDRALIKHRLRSRTNPVAILVAETQFLAAALNKARLEVQRLSIEAERQKHRADALLWNMQAANRAAGLEPRDEPPAPSLPQGEHAARERAGMPSGHPESLGAELDETDEESLASLCLELWPGDEYEDITAEGDAA
jgi:hypothetical protein